MTEALNLSGPASLDQIHLDEPRELAYWAHLLDIPVDDLKAVVASVGPRTADVRHHISRLRHAAWQRERHPPPHHVQPSVEASGNDTLSALLVGCAIALATMFGALAFTYNQSAVDEWIVTFQRERGCDTVPNADPAIERLRCPGGRTVARGDAKADFSAKPSR
jgi:hypothetical protein